MRATITPTLRTLDESMLRAFLDHVPEFTNGCAELRLLNASLDCGGLVVRQERFSSTVVGWFDDPSALVSAVRRASDVSAYVTLNPINRALLARASNRLIAAKRGETTTDADVLCLRWLFVDIDPDRPSGISATDQERAAAIARRDLILAETPTLATSALWGTSGNGAFILVRLPDYPNDVEHRQRIGQALALLAKRYSGDGVTIDTATKNPGRVMCVPGTWKCKGENVLTRPWRLATLDRVAGVAP